MNKIILNNSMSIKTDRKFVVVERELSKGPLEKKPLKQVFEPKNIYDVNTDKDFISPYARKDNKFPSNANYSGTFKSGEAQLEYSQNNNVSLNGWSAKEVAQKREELSKTLKPETIEAMKKYSAQKKLTKKVKSKEENLLSKIEEICNEKILTVKNEIAEEKKKDETVDISFIPIKPDNTYLNMKTVEFDKLEWMKQVESKAESTKSLSIRFHINGCVIEPDLNMDEDYMSIVEKEYDPYEESLHHHGEEPSREGYTINELFWLSRSKFAQQRHLAVTTLINIVNMSKSLEHAHQFNVTMITQNLVDCGILFLARWLIDDAGLTYNSLDDAFRLLHAILVDDNSDKWLLSWPDVRVKSCLPRLMSHTATKSDRSRQMTPASERTEIPDEILLDEDVITCLVKNTHLLTRMSWLIYGDSELTPSIHEMMIEILQRVAFHSPEMASHLCNEHSSLVNTLTKMHLKSDSPSCASLLRLLRIMAHSSGSLAHKLTRDKSLFDGLYTLIEVDTGASEIKCEAIRLLVVFVLRDVYMRPIAEMTPIIIEILVNDITLQDHINHSIGESAATFLVSLIFSNANISLETYDMIKVAINHCYRFIRDRIHNQEDYRIVSALIHLCNTFYLHQRTTSRVISATDVTIDYWMRLVRPVLESSALPSISQQVAQNTVLGYEHWNQNHKLVKLDLVNLLQYSTKLAAQTANPNYIDLKPFVIDLHPSTALLSAVSHMVQSLIDSKLSPSLLPEFIATMTHLVNNQFIRKHVTKIAVTPMDKVAPSTSPYSAVVQLELETLTQVLLTIVGLAQWTELSLSPIFATVIYKAAIRVLPCLGPTMQHLAHKLCHMILFSPTMVSLVECSLTTEINTLLLQQLPSIMQLYIDNIPSFEPPSPLLENLTSSYGIDHVLITNDWIDAPILELYDNIKRNNDIQLERAASMMQCLTFSMFLDIGNLCCTKQSLITGLYRLSYLLISVDWIDTLSEDNNNKLIVTSLLKHYLSQPSLLDINCRVNKKLSFYDLYQDLLHKYFFESLSDQMMANIVMFPCAMRFPAKYRRHLWSDFYGHLRLLTIDVDQSIFPMEEYLSPDERDHDMLEYYWRAVCSGKVTLATSPLLYWICVHHLNRFVYDRTVNNSDTIDCNGDNKTKCTMQRAIARAMCAARSATKLWLQHIRLYKRYSSDTTSDNLYDTLPLIRQQYLDSLLAD